MKVPPDPSPYRGHPYDIRAHFKQTITERALMSIPMATEMRRLKIRESGPYELYRAGWLHDFNLSLWVDPMRFGNLLTTVEAIECQQERNSMHPQDRCAFEGREWLQCCGNSLVI